MFSLEEIKSQKYISLETYRKNNQAVKTPVWFVVRGDLIYVVTREQTGKVKRLRNNSQVKFALCTMRGRVTGDWIPGTAKILSGQEIRDAVKMRDGKYGFMARIAKFASRDSGEFFAFTVSPS